MAKEKRIAYEEHSTSEVETVLIDILEQKHEADQRYLTIETVEKVFQHQGILCTLGTAMHLYVRSSKYLRRENINIRLKESIGAVIALIYKKIDYGLFIQAVIDKRDTGLFYVLSVLLQAPEMIFEIDETKLFSRETDESALQYICLLYRYTEKWDEIKKRCKGSGECKIERKKEEHSKAEAKGITKKRSKQIACRICRIDHSIQKYTKNLKEKSLLWMVAAGDAQSIRKYLDENARTPSALAVFLEKVFPKVNISVRSMQSFDGLDPSETFKYPERIRLLPQIRYTSKTIEVLEGVYTEKEEKREIWLLFLESVIQEIYQTEKILTDKFPLQVLIRAPTISQIVCKNYLKTREETVIRMGIEILEGIIQVTAQEEANAHRTLDTLAESTPSKTVSQDIRSYLSKKKNKNFSNYLRYAEENTLYEVNKPSQYFAKTLEQAKEIAEILNTTDMCSAPFDAPCTPIELIKIKKAFFESVKNLSPVEKQCIEDYLKNKNIEYATHLRSIEYIVGSSSNVKQIVDLFYSVDLDEISPSLENMPEHSCVYATNALIHSVYPEKYFLFLLLTKILHNKFTLSYLEIYSINHALEYLYAYDRELFNELDRICKEITKKGKIQLEPVGTSTQKQQICNVVNTTGFTSEDSSQKTSRKHKKNTNSAKISLRLVRHGAMSNAKQRIVLAKYQNSFFTKYYNAKEIEQVIGAYFSGVLPFASLQILLFMCEMPSTVDGILEAIPCKSSKEFLRIFYYASSNVAPPDAYAYTGIYEILRKDKGITEQTRRNNSAEISGLSRTNSEISMYCNREKDEGFITAQSTPNEDGTDLPESKEILKAAKKLTKWASSIDKTEELAYIFADSMIYSTGDKYVNFLQAKSTEERFRFLNSVKTGRVYTGSAEIEEILYICTRKNEEIHHALNNNKTLTRNGMHSTVTALEQKWLRMPSEVYYTKSKNSINYPSIIDEIAKIQKTKTPGKRASTTEEERKQKLASNLVLFKIEQNMHTAKHPSVLLERIEKECTERLSKEKRETNHSERKLLFKAIEAKLQYTVKEFEKKPIDVLNNHVKPYLHIDFSEDSVSVIETLAKTCLTIFNRYAMHPANHPVPPAHQKIKSNRILQKEEAAAKEIHECMARQYTEVEETAHGLGIALYIRLAERRTSTQDVISLIHLLFSDHASEKTVQSVSLEGVRTKYFLPLKQQIISKFLYLHMHAPAKTSLYRHLQIILEKFLIEFPYMVIYDLILRENKGTKPISIPSSIRTQAESVILQYKNIYSQAQSSATVLAVFPMQTPVLSCTHSNKSPNCHIHKVLPEVKRLKGINKPVLISILATDGIVYKEILKKNDDLKQDILSTQVFSYMNTVLASSRFTRTMKEQVRTYNIVALDKLFGIIEFISTAEPIGSVIDDLHTEYHPKEINSKACREVLQRYIDKPLEKKIKALKHVYKAYTPVLKKIFEGNGPFEYCKQRKAFTNSFAITSIATYILGLGDRHPHNILLDRNTHELINIDLNLIFDQGKALAISEKVPFRMTRNLQQGIIAGTDCSYDRGMERFLEALKKSKENLLVFVNILQNEPLHRWRAIQKIAQIETMFSDYKSILNRLKDKLNGIEDGFILSNSAHVQCLVQRAVDIANHASIYPGWSSWM